MNIFEKAARMKLRFESPKGDLTVEDLYDLPLTKSNGANLNDVAKTVNRALKSAEEEDFVHKVTMKTEYLQMKLDIVKHVIATKIAENEEARLASVKKVQKERILEILDQKQNESLKGKSEEELHQLLASL